MWQAGFWHAAEDRPANDVEVRAICNSLGWTRVEQVDEGIWHIEVDEQLNLHLQGGGIHESEQAGIQISIDQY